MPIGATTLRFNNQDSYLLDKSAISSFSFSCVSCILVVNNLAK